MPYNRYFPSNSQVDLTHDFVARFHGTDFRCAYQGTLGGTGADSGTNLLETESNVYPANVSIAGEKFVFAESRLYGEMIDWESECRRNKRIYRWRRNDALFITLKETMCILYIIYVENSMPMIMNISSDNH